MGWGQRGLQRMLCSENKSPFFVGKWGATKRSDGLISGFESHTLIICQD